GLPLDVSAPGSGGLTPLHLAAQQGHDMAIKVLVGALGADASRRDHGGHRAYHYLRPDAPPDLRELAGADEGVEAPAVAAAAGSAGTGRRKGPPGNANNNCSISRRSWTAPRSAAERREKGSRVTHIQGFFRQLFSFFQDP
ncbi:ankyrin repeat domain-containing protein SOWAHD, partial [Gracilinanus agilis]|uniref:ankyrin repeat domain-containing protein SOWAHD n=1 Tax=Gracilinanus agilis TaxID=191870 RepID=UPI001CFD4CBF